MQTVTWTKRSALIIALATTVFIFSKILSHQKSTNDAQAALSALIDSGKILQLKSWKAVYYFCYYAKGATTSDSCHEDPLAGESKVIFPLQKFTNPVVNFEINSSKESKPANTVHLKYTLHEKEKSILSGSNEWTLLIPRNSQRASFLGSNMAGEADYGHISDSSFGVTLNQLKISDSLELIINYKTLPVYGPLDVSPALVHPNSTRDYTSIYSKQAGGAALSKQLLVGLPLVMGIVASVLDHSPTMLILALFGALRAVHTYFGFLSESLPLAMHQEILSYFCLGASFALLMMFIEMLCGIRFRRIKRWHRIVFPALCGCLAVAGRWTTSNYSLKSTLVVDSLSSACGIFLIGIFLALRIKASKKQTGAISSRLESQEEGTLSKSLFYGQLALTAAALAIHGSVNSFELVDQIDGTSAFTDPLDWRHMMLMPALLCAGLLEVGSVAKRMLSFGHEMAEKAVIERELKVGHDVQARMLPEKKHVDELWKWRAVYHPAEALAGDWFDIREIPFSDGRKLLAVCLADVTGHGVGSSLSTSVICSHWSLWCAGVGQQAFPEDKKTREEMLCTAPLRIHVGLSALRKNENCTAMVALIDPYSKEVSISSAGHPGAFLINPKGLRYMTTTGERLGGELVGEAKWNPKTDTMGDEDLLVIYSDGIVPVGVTVLSWAGKLKKKILEGEKKAEIMLLKTLQENKLAFMKDPSNEDDMTLIMIRLNSTATIQA
jgi:hypothetical protein